jgi:uncharacterized MAPEG superfamily protein
MHFAYWMLLAAAMLPYVTIYLVKRAGGRRFDNQRPRAWLEEATGWQQRGDWAHRNHFESFPVFAAAVFVAEMTQAPQGRIDLLAGLYVAVRVVYTALYLANLATLRSIVWALGLVVTVWLFVLGA